MEPSRFPRLRRMRPSRTLVPGGQVCPPACGLPATSLQGGQQGSPVLVQNLEKRGLRPHGRKGHEDGRR